MEDFKGLSRDTVRAKTPSQYWEFARNILLSKGYLSVTNEDGFDYKHDVPGIFIGKIETNEEVVYFSVDGPFSCIGIYRTNEDLPEYIPIIRTQYLGFKVNRPIEGIFFYNYKGELIVSFCDGVFLDSNTPKIINLTAIGIDLDINLELINPNDINQLDLTPAMLVGDIDVSYNDNGSLEGNAVYITYAYILSDGITSSSFHTINTLAYPLQEFRKKISKALNIEITNLDSNYNKLKIGILIVKEGGLFAYESTIRSYNGTTYNTLISGLSSYISISTDSLLIPSIIYSRIKTMTLVNSELSIGNLAVEDNLKFQKYANLLELGLRFDTREEQYYNHPTLLPDEVYSFTIAGHLLNGDYTEEFHIPGRVPNAGELDELDSIELEALGIETLTPNPIKKFRVFNTGGFVGTDSFCRDVFSPQAELTFGYWQNEELYPDDINYNSLIDYNNNPIIGGQDLRNTPIRYHRIPGLDNLVKNFPCILGTYNKNIEEAVGFPDFNGAVPAFAVHVKNFDEVIPIEIRNKLQGYRISIVKRTREDCLVEDISFLKQAMVKTFASAEERSIGLNFLTSGFDGTSDELFTTDVMQFGYSKLLSTNLTLFKPQIVAKLIKANYAIGMDGIAKKSESPEIPEPYIDTLSTNFKEGTIGINTGNSPFYSLVPDEQRFAVIKSVTYLPNNNIAAKTRYVEDSIILEAFNSLVPLNGFSNTEVANRWNPLLWNLSSSNRELYGTLYGFSVDNIGGEFIGSYKPYNYTGRGLSGTGTAINVGISVTLINFFENVYKGFSPLNFIEIGRVSLRNNINDYTLENQLLRNGGDIFTNNMYNKICSLFSQFDPYYISFSQVIALGSFGTSNNAEIYSNSDKPLEIITDVLTQEQMDSYDYTDYIYNEITTASLLDIISFIAFNINSQFINYFPYRIQRSLKLANENLSTANIRTFPANKYQEMLNDRGEIIALRGSNKILYIQQRFSLFIASLKDKLTTQDSVTYLGEGDIFDRTPDEVMDASNKGFLGSSSQFACILYRDGLVTIDQVKGKIYIISGNQALEISKQGLENWCENYANIDNKFYSLNRLGIKQNIDNPYTQVGHLIGFDLKYNRLLWTKKEFEFNNESLEEGEILTFDGQWYYINNIKLNYNNIDRFNEISRTFSFDLDGKNWVCEHDYFPNCYAYTNRGTYAFTILPELSQVYKMNSKLNKGTYFGITFESYFDPIFNSRLDISKLYQNITWNSVVYGVNGEAKYFKTIDAIMLYNDVQCSGIIDLIPNTNSLKRNLEGNWNFNDFRDLVIDKTLPLIDIEGRVIESNINKVGSWFEKSNFINTFIVVRMIMKNETNDSVYINIINVKSRMSDRT